MGRWQPDTRARLAKAALALFGEQGYEQTTVAEIAERAGLTERTFFRHFADKREVLFAGDLDLAAVMAAATAGAPSPATAVEALTAGLQAGADVLEPRRPFARQRHAVIAANAELRERELIKLAAMGSALAEALRRRGVPEPTAALMAEVGVAVFRVAFDRWVREGEERALPTLVQRSLDELRTVAAG